jgi:plastocyanin
LRKLLIAIGAAAVLAPASVAQAASWHVALGEQARPPAGTPKGATLDQFMPNRLTIDAGDAVTFSSASFHTVTFLAGSKPPGLFIPDPAGGKYTGVTGADGSPFFFEGLMKFIYNPVAFGPVGGKTIPGAGPVSSGVLAPNGPKQKVVTATYTFPKAGSYRLVCNVHPGMKLDVVVKPKGAAVPRTPSQVDGDILAQQSAGWAKAAALEKAAKEPANTVAAGLGSNVALLAYYPKVLKVKAGTTVNFVNKSSSEVHDAAFGPRKFIDAFMKKYDQLPQGPNSPNQVAPVLPYGTEPKGEYSLDGSNHGNGFLVTPLTAGAKPVPLPKAAAVTFTKPGTYKYFCLIHGPDMSGTIVVTP